jgi:hypothetical protein
MIALGLAMLNPAIFFDLDLCLLALTAFLLWTLVESRFLASSSHYREGSPKASA